MGVIAESTGGTIRERIDLVRSARQERVNRTRRARREREAAERQHPTQIGDVPNSFPVPRQPARPTVLLSDDQTAIPVLGQQVGQVFVAPVGYPGTYTPMLGSEMREIHIQEYLAAEARVVARMAERGDEGPLPEAYQITRDALGIDQEPDPAREQAIIARTHELDMVIIFISRASITHFGMYQL
jgi:hypothetical protein